VFVPAIFLVLISYTSFYIDYKVAPARCLLGVVPILTSFTQLAGVMRKMPRFSYQSWIVDFLFAHALFTVIAMLEFAVISYIDFHVILNKEAAEAKKKTGGYTPLGFSLGTNKAVTGETEEKGKVELSYMPRKNEEEEKKSEIALVPEEITPQVVAEITPPKKLSFQEKLLQKDPRYIDRSFRVIYLVSYLVVLFTFLMLPISNEYE
jgi:hypothetical protein